MPVAVAGRLLAACRRGSSARRCLWLNCSALPTGRFFEDDAQMRQEFCQLIVERHRVDPFRRAGSARCMPVCIYRQDRYDGDASVACLIISVGCSILSFLRWWITAVMGGPHPQPLPRARERGAAVGLFDSPGMLSATRRECYTRRV